MARPRATVVPQCCVCGRIRVAGGKLAGEYWVEPTEEVKAATHTYCPTCFAEAMAQLARLPPVGQAGTKA
jgi:hypothetical protein